LTDNNTNNKNNNPKSSSKANSNDLLSSEDLARISAIFSLLGDAFGLLSVEKAIEEGSEEAAQAAIANGGRRQFAPPALVNMLRRARHKGL
jgi:hypothetical protein